LGNAAEGTLIPSRVGRRWFNGSMPRQASTSPEQTKPLAAVVTVVTVTGALVAAVLAGLAAGLIAQKPK